MFAYGAYAKTPVQTFKERIDEETLRTFEARSDEEPLLNAGLDKTIARYDAQFDGRSGAVSEEAAEEAWATAIQEAYDVGYDTEFAEWIADELGWDTPTQT